MARKLSIVLAVVLAIFAASPNLGHAQGRGGGFHSAASMAAGSGSVAAGSVAAGSVAVGSVVAALAFGVAAGAGSRLGMGLGLAGRMVGLWSRLGRGSWLGLGRRLGLGPRVGLDLALE